MKKKKSLGCCCDGEIDCTTEGKVLMVAIAPPDFKLGDDESDLKWVDVNNVTKNNASLTIEIENTKSMLKKGTHPNQKFYESMGLWDKNELI